MPSGNVIWPSPSHPDIFACLSCDPRNNIDSLAVHQFFPVPSDASTSDPFDSRCFYIGETEDTAGLVDLRSKSGEFAVNVASGMDTRVDIINRSGKLFSLYGADNREAFSGFDVKKVEDEYVMACILSSGLRKEPPNIWTGRVCGSERVCVY